MHPTALPNTASGTPQLTAQVRASMRAALLDWYDATARPLAWRVLPADRARGVRPDPYAVWLSEIMCQQTTVAAATPYYQRFLAQFPSVHALADAELDEVLRLWAGLGYYARARNLHACAQVIAARGGAFPSCEADLLQLPGVGPYTAAAIAAVCFDAPSNVVDGNVERVIARLFAIAAPLPGARGHVRAAAASLVDTDRPGDYAQALMDLGATVCTPKSPACGACPWRAWCEGARAGAPTAYPVKTRKAAKPHRQGVVFVVEHAGAVWLRRRPPSGLLAGMTECPGTPWREAAWSDDEAHAHAPIASAPWQAVGAVAHVFTHFTLSLDVQLAQINSGAAAALGAGASGWWADADGRKTAALPSVMRKVIERALGA